MKHLKLNLINLTIQIVENMMTKLIRLSFLWHFINNGVNCAPKPAALTCTPS